MALIPWRSRITEKEFWYQYDFGSHGTYNSYWNDHIKNDPNLERVSFCVDIVLSGGTRFRLSNKPVSATDSASNVVLAFNPVLLDTPSVDSTYTLGSGSASLRSFGITFGNIDFNPWDVIFDYGNLAGWAEISLIADDGDWENRFIIMRGDMTGGVTFGAVQEDMSVEIVDPKYAFDIAVTPYLIISSTLEGSEYTRGNFSEAPSESQAKRFPLIINDCPNYVPALALRTETPMWIWGGSSDVSAHSNEWMICFGHKHAASDFAVNKYPHDGSATWSVHTDQSDSLYGAPYTSISILNRYVADYSEPEPEWNWESWKDCTVFTKIYNSERNYSPKNAIQIIRSLLEEWSLFTENQLNSELFEVALSKIGPAIPRGIINGSGESDSSSIIQFIESTLCGEFPMISMTYHGGGYGPIVTDRFSDVVRGEYTIGQGPIYSRISSYNETAKSSLFNRFTVKYDFDCMLGDYQSVIIRDASNNAWCRMSERMCGTLDKGVIELAYVHDDQTAAYISDWLVGHFALPSYVVEYCASPSVITWLRLGDNIDIYDPDIKDGTEKVRATVEGINYGSSSCSVRLRLWPKFTEYAAGTVSGKLSWSGAGIFMGVGSSDIPNENPPNQNPPQGGKRPRGGQGKATSGTKSDPNNNY